MADKTINELTAATTMGNDDLLVLQQGGVAKKLSGKQLGDYVYKAAAEKITEVNQAVSEARTAIDQLNEDKDNIAQSIASMAELGTDTTLTTSGMAADAKATGDRLDALDDASLAMFNTASATPGSIATIDDGADNIPIKKLVVNIEPVQSGTGDPSPDNVRPITGWTGVDVSIHGNNLLNYATEITGKRLNNEGGLQNSTYAATSDYIPVKPLISIYGRLLLNAGSGYAICEYDKNKQFIRYQIAFSGSGYGSKTYTLSDNTCFIRCTYDQNHTDNPAILYPSSNTDFAPYSGETIPITFSEITKNKFDVSQANLTANWTINGDGSDQTYNSRSATKGYIPILPSTEYTLSYTEAFKNGVFFYQSDYTLISYLAWGSQPRAFTTPQNAAYVRVSFYAGTPPTNVQLELGSSATSYEPYNGTVYGGTLTINEDGSGELTTNLGLVTFDGSEDEGWQEYSAQDGFFSAAISDMSSGTRQDGISNWLPNNKNGSASFTSFWNGVNNKRVYAINVSSLLTEYTVSAWKTYLSTNPLQVTFPIDSPVTYQLTAAEIRTLLGTNNVWADTGDITEFIYRKSAVTSAELDSKISTAKSETKATIESIIAGREDAMKATKNYSSGDLVIVNDALYKLDTNVASGESLIPEINCHITTVAAVITSRVPSSRTINGKALSSDVALTAEDIAYDDSLSEHTSGSVGEVVSGLKSDLTEQTEAFEDIAEAELTSTLIAEKVAGTETLPEGFTTGLGYLRGMGLSNPGNLAGTSNNIHRWFSVQAITDLDVYFYYPHGSFQNICVFNNASYGESNRATPVYQSNNDTYPVPTAENPLHVSAGQYITFSEYNASVNTLSDFIFKLYAVVAGTYSLKSTTPLTDKMAEEVDEKIGIIDNALKNGYMPFNTSWERGGYEGYGSKDSRTFRVRSTGTVEIPFDAYGVCDLGFQFRVYYEDGTSTSLASVAKIQGNKKFNIYIRRYTEDIEETAVVDEFSAAVKYTTALAPMVLLNSTFTDISMFERVGVCGDSYAGGGGIVSGVTSLTWGKNLGRQAGINVDIYAKSGIDLRGWNQSTTYGLPALLAGEECGLYLLQHGINDTLYSIGTPSDMQANPKPETFYGQYAYAIEAIKEAFPNARIVIATIVGTSYANYSLLYGDINTAIKNIAEYEQIPCIDVIDDDFYKSTWYSGTARSNHPTAITNAGIAMANRRLISKCIRDNPYYFIVYGSNDSAYYPGYQTALSGGEYDDTKSDNWKAGYADATAWLATFD